jgi:hypothetical protein
LPNQPTKKHTASFSSASTPQSRSTDDGISQPHPPSTRRPASLPSPPMSGREMKSRAMDQQNVEPSRGHESQRASKVKHHFGGGDWLGACQIDVWGCAGFSSSWGWEGKRTIYVPIADTPSEPRNLRPAIQPLVALEIMYLDTKSQRVMLHRLTIFSASGWGSFWRS